MLATLEREPIALTCSLPTPTPPPSSRSRSKELSGPEAETQHGGAFYIHGKVLARGGAAAGEGGAAHCRRPAVVKGQLGRGAPTSASGWQNPGKPSREPASLSGGRPPGPTGHAGPAGVARADSHSRPPRLERSATPLLPLPALLQSLVIPTVLSGPVLLATYTLGTQLVATVYTERWNLSRGVSDSSPPLASSSS